MDFDGEGTNSANEREEEEEGEDTSSWPTSFSLWEDECMRELELVGGGGPDIDQQLSTERDAVNHRLWLLFQASACSIAQLYKDRTHGQWMWPSFQSAAGNVTHMYKECLESQKKINEMCVQSGAQRRNKDVVNWLKKKKSRSIRREELLAFICNKSYANGKHRSPRRMNDSFSSGITTSTASSVFTSSPNHVRSPQNLTFACLSLTDPSSGPGIMSTGQDPVPASDLQPFREALALSASGAGGGRGGRNRPLFPSATAASPNELAELNAFIADEFSRNLDSKKRSYSSSPDVIMSSPTTKKAKYL